MDLPKTLVSLLALGFEIREPRFGEDSVGYRFGNCDLVATVTMGQRFRPVVALNGTVSTRRVLGMVDAEIPVDLDSPEAAAAWVSHVLKPHRADLGPLPTWFLEGEEHWELIPHVRRQRAYKLRPHCVMRREHARILRRDLRRALGLLKCQCDVMVDFDGRVLTLRVGGDRIAALATGRQWPKGINWAVSADTELPTRFAREWVEFGYFDGHLEFSSRRYPATEIGG